MTTYHIDHMIISAEVWLSAVLEIAKVAAAAQAAGPVCEQYELGMLEAARVAYDKYIEFSRIVNVLRDSDDCR